jgi:hypothetical protein
VVGKKRRKDEHEARNPGVGLAFSSIVLVLVIDLCCGAVVDETGRKDEHERGGFPLTFRNGTFAHFLL